jgi:glyoxylase-like metal-dependent hydrolase (beta-lactamase superfamily II)
MKKIPLTVVKVGTSTVDPGRIASQDLISLKHALGIGGGSSVTLIEGGGERLLVDTGYDKEGDISPENTLANWDKLNNLLGLCGVHPSSISKIFLTHLHRDHSGLVERFPEASWMCYGGELEGYQGPLAGRMLAVDEGETVVPNTRVILTPGHTRGHASLLWANEWVKIAIAGDSILSLSWLNSGYIWKFNSDFGGVEAARKSAKKLLESADLVIPGHGQAFFSSAVGRWTG